MADGKVSIDVDLNEEKARKEAEKLYKEYEKQTRELEKQREYLQKLERRYERLGNTAQRKIKTAEDEVKRQTTALNRQEKAVDSLQKKYDQIASGGRSGTVLQQNILNATVDVQLLEKEFDKLREVEAAALERLKAAQAQRDSGKTITDPDAFTNWENVEKQVDALSNKIHEAESKVAELQERLSLLKLNSQNSEEAKKLKEEIAAATEKMQEYEKAVNSAKESLSSAKEAAAGFDENSAEARVLKEEIAAASEKVKEYEATVEDTSQKVVSAYEKIRENANSVNQSLENTTGYLSASKSIIEAIGDASKKASEVMYNVFDSVTHRLYVMIRRRLFYYALWGTINTIIDGIKELAETDDDVNNTVSQLYSSIEYLKNSLINSFLPVLEAITPLLTTIIDAVADLVNILGKLFAVLTGNDFTAVTKETLDYAASLDEAEESAEKALAAFDELNILDFGDDEDDSGDSDDDSPETIETLDTESEWDPGPIIAWVDDFNDHLEQMEEALSANGYAILAWEALLQGVTLPDWVTDVITVPSPVFEAITWPSWIGMALQSPYFSPATILAPVFATLELPDWVGSILESPVFEPAIITAPEFEYADFQVALETVLELATEWATVSIPSALEGLLPGFELAFEAVTEYVPVLQTALEAISEYIAVWVDKTIPGYLGQLSPAFQLAYETILADTGTFADSFPALLAGIGEAIYNYLTSPIVDNGNSFITGLQYILQAAYDFRENILEQFYETAVALPELILSSLQSAYANFAVFFTGASAMVHEAFSNIISVAWEGICNFASSIVDKIKGVFETISSLLEGLGFALNVIWNVNTNDDASSYSLSTQPITFSGTLSWAAAAVGAVSAGAGIAGILSLIPAFANGAVIEPNHEFAAILGDNKVEQEVVSPLSTMKEAFTEALNESGMTRSGNISLSIDGTEFARIIYPYSQSESARRGNSLIRSGAR